MPKNLDLTPSMPTVGICSLTLSCWQRRCIFFLLSFSLLSCMLISSNNTFQGVKQILYNHNNNLAQTFLDLFPDIGLDKSRLPKPRIFSSWFIFLFYVLNFCSTAELKSAYKSLDMYTGGKVMLQFQFVCKFRCIFTNVGDCVLCFCFCLS